MKPNQKPTPRPLIEVLAETGLLDDVDESILKGLLTDGANLSPNGILPNGISQIGVDGYEHPHPGAGAP